LYYGVLSDASKGHAAVYRNRSRSQPPVNAGSASVFFFFCCFVIFILFKKNKSQNNKKQNKKKHITKQSPVNAGHLLHWNSFAAQDWRTNTSRLYGILTSTAASLSLSSTSAVTSTNKLKLLHVDVRVRSILHIFQCYCCKVIILFV
jgi:hypothetical protein